MVGREVQLTVDRGESHPAAVTLHVEDLVVKNDRGREVVHDVSFEVRAGEIFGIAGVAGNGQDELVEAITGLRRPASGRILLDGADITHARHRASCMRRASRSCPPTGTASAWCCRSR